ncbi:MAG: hypothetical protein ACJ8CB_24375 [Ktedonobacteraceae bacterium]
MRTSSAAGLADVVTASVPQSLDDRSVDAPPELALNCEAFVP